MGNKEQFLHIWRRSSDFVRLQTALHNRAGPCSLFGISDAPAIHLTAALMQESEQQSLIITATEHEAMQVFDELQMLLGSDVVYLPARPIQLQAYVGASRELAAKRIIALQKIHKQLAKICVASAQTMLVSMVPGEVMKKSSWVLSVGELLEVSQLPQKMHAMGYERVEQVSGGGQYRMSGAIFDVFVPGEEHPFRLELFDDEIDSLRIFDESSQRSLQKIDSITIPCATEVPIDENSIKRAKDILAKSGKLNEKQKERIQKLTANLQHAHFIEGIEQILPLFYEPCSLVSHFNGQPNVFLIEPNRIEEQFRVEQSSFIEKMSSDLENGDALPFQSGLILETDQLWKQLDTKKTLLVSALTRTFNPIRSKEFFEIEARSAAQYAAAIDQLADDLRFMRKQMAIVIFAGKRAKKLVEDLAKLEVHAIFSHELSRQPLFGEILILDDEIVRGFESSHLKIAFFSEQDIYGTRKRAVKIAKKTTVNKLDLFAQLEIGDYVVHEKYGIGIFQGIETHATADKSRDFLVIQYAGNDRVGVSTDELDRVQKYIGNADRVPKISKLGGADWTKTVSKVRSSVKQLAFDLVELYAKRQAETGYAFSPDTVWQRQLEDDFPYEETPGQLRSIQEIKRDMESKRVMDRLLCGDVGYGKTEVAVRAAFKAAQDSKQVAMLVPTTILAQQHYLTFMRRLEGYPITIESLSRLKTAAQQREILKRLKNGQIDIIIGTHRLLGKDIEFKDLGLLIVDEEQRFGVAHKELIKNLKKNVDVLTLSATPIPRTLHMSMLGIRDMSVIDSPPEERFPVTTYVIEYSNQLVVDAISKEIAHGGQVYILYNHVSNMERYVGELSKLLPDVSFGMAHGQMPQGQLEKTMLAFLNKQHDVLVCSTIIESGMDIPNVNTIIVFDSDRFGLSQLYQLRGRVGRSNRLAYAYLTFRKDKVLNEVAEKRLRAIREFTEFGSGFKIALRDLEIRGAGNIIGAQQHGHMDEIGYDFYCKLIDQAVKEIRGEPEHLQVDTQMDVSMNAFLPHEYIQDEPQRLELYKRIASIENRTDFYDVQEELEDRFGEIPECVQSLLDIALLKAKANMAKIEQIFIRAQEVKIKFHPQAEIDTNALFALLKTNHNWTFVPDKKTLMIRFFQKSATVEVVFEQLKDMIEKITVCITTAH